jgi:hypothetical protein
MSFLGGRGGRGAVAARSSDVAAFVCERTVHFDIACRLLLRVH